jgi:hypothetical protein
MTPWDMRRRFGAGGGIDPNSARWLGLGVASAGSIATTRPLSYSGALVGALDSNVTTVTTTTVNGVVRYANKMFALAGSNLSIADISDLTVWTTGVAYPVAGNYPHINVSGDRLFFCSYPATGAYYLDSPLDTSWTFVSVGAPVGGGSSNTVSGSCGNGSGVLFIGYYGQLWRSLDNGVTTSVAADMYGADRFQAAMTGSADVNGSRFVICGRGNAGLNAYRTDNVGLTVSACTFPSGREDRAPMQVKYCGGDKWLMALDVAVTPTSDGLLLAVDNGATFVPVDLPVQMYFYKAFSQSIAVDANSGRVVIAGYEHGTGAPKMYYADLATLTTGSASTIWTEISLTGTEAKGGISEIYPIGATP